MTASPLESTASDLVSVDVATTGSSVLVTVVGEVDSSSAPAVGERFDALLEGELRELTVDLVGVTFLDSAGLCVLASAHRRAVAAGVEMRVLASSRAVIRPLQITGLWTLLNAEQVDPAQPAQESVGAA